jgi:uncharacterized membrane protein YidH (DUF202 family)
MEYLTKLIDILLFIYTLLLLICSLQAWWRVAHQIGIAEDRTDVRQCFGLIGLGAILAMPFFGLLYYWGWL